MRFNGCEIRSKLEKKNSYQREAIIITFCGEKEGCPC